MPTPRAKESGGAGGVRCQVRALARGSERPRGRLCATCKRSAKGAHTNTRGESANEMRER